jgi:hypothetical protein
MKRKLFFLSAFLLCVKIISAQITPVVSGSKDKILIGEPLRITFELKAIDRSSSITWKFPDSLEHFEYIQFDTSDILKREITVTSWDSGAWQLKGIRAIVPSNVSGKPQVLEFASKEILVEYDTTGSGILNDIKPIIEVSGIDEPWIAYSLIAAAIICLLLLVYLFKKWKANQTTTIAFDPPAGAYEELTKTLNELKTKNWNTQADQKIYFSELTSITKRFLERSLQQPYSKYTTDEIAFHLDPAAGKESGATITQVMRLADAVKFAKFAAPESECMNAINQTETILKQLHQQQTA